MLFYFLWTFRFFVGQEKFSYERKTTKRRKKITKNLFFFQHPKARFEKVDAKVIDAHIVPENVLFLGPTAEGEQFKTLAFTDMLRVDAYLSKSEEGEKTRCKTWFYIHFSIFFRQSNFDRGFASYDYNNALILWFSS